MKKKCYSPLSNKKKPRKNFIARWIYQFRSNKATKTLLQQVTDNSFVCESPFYLF